MMISHRLLVCALLASIGAIGCGGAGTEGQTSTGCCVATPCEQQTCCALPGETAPVVELTAACEDKVSEIIRQGQADGSLPKERLHVRVRVVAGGCQGFLHKIDLDPTVGPKDQVISTGDVSAVVSADQVEMLRGTRIDYVNMGKEVGFTVKNPNFEGEAVKKWLPVLEGQEKER
jgi:iron-sulfur cluster assembly accessory protein